MKIRKTTLCLALLVTIVFTLSSCEVSGSINSNVSSVGSVEEPSKDSSVVEDPVSSKNEESSEESKMDSIKEDLLYNIGNINFSYADSLVIKEIEGLPYFYYNETSFFYAESVVMDVGGEDIDETFVTMFFDSAKESFSQGSWQNGEIANAPTV